MIKLFSVISFLWIGTIVSIYSLSVPGVGNTTINFVNYQNKKIFIVNTASASNKVGQLTQLQQLYLQHKDSMVVIAFPSNSFGNEPKTNPEIKIFMQQTYGITFPIAKKSKVKGDEANIVYEWIRRKMQNGVMNGKTRYDFQKFLINRSGQIVGVFDSSVSPISTLVQNAIHDN